MQDRLFLLRTDFADPAYPDQRFFCWHCMLLEGILASFPRIAETLDVRRVAWPRPRQSIVDLIGIENQSLPILMLADDANPNIETSVAFGQRFVEGKDAILNALAIRHGIPVPHP